MARKRLGAYVITLLLALFGVGLLVFGFMLDQYQGERWVLFALGSVAVLAAVIFAVYFAADIIRRAD